MAKYSVLINSKVQKQLEKVPEPYYSNIKKAILDLANNPRPNGYKKLKGRPEYRIREGNYRVIYDIHDDVLNVLIIKVGHRKDIY
jgi:mRNA interferase RelE/StbE